jgi:hypothetical protein
MIAGHAKRANKKKTIKKANSVQISNPKPGVNRFMIY